ncbi:L-lactate dehydrogenase A-like 6A [Gracilariopsis chorda]|uniref:L-lactate dehydrogenase A-like 6A n=1 Tax=Gracilariopsis chorda TaxID=448386 RepID=A0A2V3J5R0_9FLOR|nr:L-lactate dehydrogenase A-like 6A [Gracilariopsis chorda]|eukprot:PXF49714.1 L-lactate dehydrogenase A-like 6A [Gracilariopsis chorda]
MSVFPNEHIRVKRTERRVSLIGLTEYGSAFALALVARNCATKLTLVDKHYEKAKGEALDLQDALPFLPDIHLTYSSDIRATANSHVVVITVGQPFTSEYSSRHDLIEHNAPRVAEVAFRAASVSPHAVILIGTDPIDVMTYVAACAAFQARPQFPKGYRVIGLGTGLDIARMRAEIAIKANVTSSDVSANGVGEHGIHFIPLWRYCLIRGMPVHEVCPDLASVAMKQAIATKVKQACSRIVKGKPEGTTRGLAECMADLSQALLTGVGNIRTVTTRVTAQHVAGIKGEVYMSVPCKIDAEGVAGILPFEVDPIERAALLEAARVLSEAQAKAERVLSSLDEYKGIVSVGLPSAALRSVRSLPLR